MDEGPWKRRFPFASGGRATPVVLWVAAWVCVLVWVCGRLLPYRGEEFDQRAYALLGAGLPAATLALALVGRASGRRLLTSLAGLSPVLGAMVLGTHWSPMFLVMAAAQVAVAQLAVAAPGAMLSPRFSVTAATVASFIAWAAASSLLWWRNWGQLEADPLAWVLLSGITLAVAYAVFETPGALAAKRLRWLIIGPALGVMAMACSRLDLDFGHGGFVAGPIELLRQGGWLLWDVPSQYGFLSVWTLAWLPTHDAFQAVVIGNSLLLLASAVLFFRRTLKLLPGPVGALVAAAATLAAVLMVPGWAPDLVGANRFPSVGAFRFLWVYVLLEILVAVHEARDLERRRRWLLAVGCGVWLVASLWSAESAAGSTAVWLPAYGWIVWRRPPTRHRAVALLAPALLAALGVGSVELIYRLRLGHGPDWMGFIDFLLAYQGGFGALVASWTGAVAFLIGLLAVTLAGGVLVLWENPERQAVALGAIALAVSTSSYFAVRSHENNVVNIVPVLLFSAMAVLGVVASEQRAQVTYLRLAIAPFLVVTLFAAFGEPPKVAVYARSVLRGRHMFSDIQETLPQTPREAVALLSVAGITAGAPLVGVSSSLVPRWPSKYWLPLAPATQFSLLPEARRAVYLQRFVARVDAGGWLLLPRRVDEGDQPVYHLSPEDPVVSPRHWLLPHLAGTHRLGRIFQGKGWMLMELERAAPVLMSAPTAQNVGS